MHNEEWKKLEGYSNYLISNKGRIKSLERRIKSKEGRTAILKEKIMKGCLTWDGYPIVKMKADDGIKRVLKIHRLVAIAFIPNPENKPQVNHIDGDKINKCAENLEWNTCSENVRHAYDTGLNIPVIGEKHHNSKLTIKAANEIRRIHSSRKITHQSLSDRFGIARSTITNIINNKVWLSESINKND